jgi:hypothetical protein
MLFVEYLKLGLARIFTRPQISIPLVISLGMTMCALIVTFSVYKNIYDSAKKIPIDIDNIYAISAHIKLGGGAHVPIFDNATFSDFVSKFTHYGTWAGFTANFGEIKVGRTAIKVTRFKGSENVFKLLGLDISQDDQYLKERSGDKVWVTRNLGDLLGSENLNSVGAKIIVDGNERIIAGFIDSIGSIETISNIPNINKEQIWTIESSFNQPVEGVHAVGEGHSVVLLEPKRLGYLPSLTELRIWHKEYLSSVSNTPRGAAFSSWLGRQPVQFELQGLRDYLFGFNKGISFIFVVSVFGLIFVTVINLSNIFLSYYQVRAKEYAIHLCNGSSIFSLLLLSIAENSPTFLLAYLFGLIGSGYIVSDLSNIAGSFMPLTSSVEISFFVVFCSFIIFLLLVVIFSSMIFVYAGYNSLQKSLSTSSKSTRNQLSLPLANSLMTLQLVISVCMLTGLMSIGEFLYESAFDDSGFDIEDEYQVSFNQVNVQNHEQNVKISTSMRESIKKAIESKIHGSRVVYFGGGPMHSINSARYNQFKAIHNVDYVGTYRVVHANDIFFDDFNIEFTAGFSNFHLGDSSSGANCVINEEMKRIMFSKNKSTNIIGEEFTLENDRSCIVTGVIKNTLGMPGDKDSKYNPVIYLSEGSLTNDFQLTLDYGVKATLSSEEISAALSRRFPFEVSRVIKLKDFYESMRGVKKGNFLVTLSFILLTSLLSLLGMVGLTLMVINSKIYELSIRRIYGASERHIIGVGVFDIIKVLIVGMILGTLASIILYTNIQKSLDILPAFNWVSISISYLIFFVFVILIVILSSRVVLNKNLMMVTNQHD